jgi:hypothetical protein
LYYVLASAGGVGITQRHKERKTKRNGRRTKAGPTDSFPLAEPDLGTSSVLLTILVIVTDHLLVTADLRATSVFPAFPTNFISAAVCRDGESR